MLCPYCHKEMEAGYLVTDGHYLTWTKDPYGSVRAKEKDGDVRISGNLFSCTDAVAHCCKECGKIIVDYSAKEA